MNERAIKGVVVDAGHGGDDPGAVVGNVLEKDLNLRAAQYLYRRFNELGIPVVLTRNSDETLDRDTRVSRILNAFGNSSDVVVLSNHMNSGGGEGAEIIYALRNNSNLARNTLDSIGNAGQITRKYYQRRLPSDTSKDYYFIHRLTGNTTPLLIEYGFIDTPSDLNRLQNNLEDYAEAVVKAVAQYGGYNYISPEGEQSNLYVVQRGDTLYSIASRFNITVNQLKQANNLTSNLLNVGQTLQIPTQQPPQQPGNNFITYTVKRGDTLYSIARDYGVSINDILDFNQLPTTVLSIGQQLLIPTEITEVEGITYTVVAGDSLYSIAQRYSVSVNDIINANNLTSNVLQIGEQLIIPTSGETPPSDIPSIPNDDEITYVVQSGDSLYSIAKRYGITANELKEYNNLTSNLLSIGQVLLIPTDQAFVTYYVQSGDNLYSIARKYNTTVDLIKQLNNLTDNNLSIGQQLLIPN